MRKFLVLVLIVLLVSCGDETLPKPKGYLSLEYPELGYNRLNNSRPYRFDVAKNTTIKNLPQNWNDNSVYVALLYTTAKLHFLYGAHQRV